MIHFATLGIADVEVQTMVSDGEALISEAGVLGLLVGPHAQDEDIARDFRHVIFYSGEGRKMEPVRLETADGKTLLGYRVDDVLTFLCEAGELLRQQPETSDMGNYLGGIVLSLSVLGLTTAIARATGAPLYPAAE